MKMELTQADESSECLSYIVDGPSYRPLQPVVR